MASALGSAPNSHGGEHMKPNINDVARLQDLTRALTNRNVSATAISTLNKALRRGISFNRVEDLSILDIPRADLDVIGDAVVFGTATAGTIVKRVEYRFTPVGEAAAFFGYQLIVRFVNGDGFTIEEAYPIEDNNLVLVDFDLAAIRSDAPITLHVNTASGSRAKFKVHGADAGGDFVEIPVAKLANSEIDVSVEPRQPVTNPRVQPTYPVKGKLISNRSDAKLDGYQIVLYAATTVTNDQPDFQAVAVAQTETNGYFVTTPLLFELPEDLTRVKAAKASVRNGSFSGEVPIRLLTTNETNSTPPTSRIPERVILPITEDASSSSASTHPECGCNELNFLEKKVVEEYSYYSVVRTSEPSIIADVLEDEREIDLQDIYGVPGVVPFRVFKKFHEIESRQLKPANFTPAAATVAPVPVTQPVLMASASRVPASSAAMAVPSRAMSFNQDLLNKLLVDHRVNEVIKGNAKPVFRGRTHLNQLNQIDWDDTPTIYQAASIAHGHLLHFKQEWMPDGYSIGDLAYSLPLAPGQKKQIAVLDWERRENAANSQSLEYQEALSHSLVRDRDISEIVKGTLNENIRGNSKATTGGIGFGLGSAVMGIIPGVGTFGSLLGISGGASVASSNANQSAARDMTASSLQSLNDRTQQATSVVRSQRATVVQTVGQGERVEATAESVANYNHCHALTIQYFEVLRHFTVRNRLAGVQECLFVPLQMTPFDVAKCLRWRNSLEAHLIKPELRKGFDAIARIENERESPFENYYDSIGYPRRNYAEQPVDFFSGELLMDFFFFNTNDKKIDDAIVAFYSFLGISLDGFRDKQITDEDLAKHVGPRAIEYLLDCFTVQTDKGVDLKLDLTLLSTFRQNAMLRISMRQSARTPTTIPREQIDAIVIKLDLSRLSPDAANNLAQFQNKYMKIRLRSGGLRYRTANFAGTLFDGRIDNDIFAGGDGAYVSTPLTREELRNPRGEDVDAANSLVHHLNENLEYYHKCLFFDMTPERRFMLLDGIIAPGKANGRSVASVVENRVIGIAGNSLILPVAPGYQLDPTIDETFDLFAQYFHDDPEPMRVSIPTRGVYAEAVMGQCNSCEKKDETRFWRWEESPIPDSPNTQILPLNTDTRRADPGNLQPKDFPNPVVNIQNAPAAPDPTGLQNLMQLLGQSAAFRDFTGLDQNQRNALAAYQKALDTAQSFGKEAAELAKTAATVQMAQDARKSGALPNEDTQRIINKQLDPDPEKEREQTHKDVAEIDQAREQNQLDDVQAKDMTEDRIRKGQGTPKPQPAPAPRKGKRKYHLTLIITDYEERPLEGAWVLNFGSLRDEEFESTGNGVVRFDVELDTRTDNILELKGNPYLTGQSFPPGAQYYYHFINLSPVVGTDPNLTIQVSQRRHIQTVQDSEGKSEADIKVDAVATEYGSSVTSSGETSGLTALFGKVSLGATISAKRVESGSTSSGTTTTNTQTTTYTVQVPTRRLAFKQKGQAISDLNLND